VDSRSQENALLCCSIRDDGAGFDIREVQKTPQRKGLGLIAMQERVTAIGGTLQIDSGGGPRNNTFHPNTIGG